MNEVYKTRRYHKPVPTFWWLRRRAYGLFALREMSCLFITWFVVFLLLLTSAIRESRSRYEQFLAMAASPWVWALNIFTLLFVLLHACTWFHLTPQAIVLRVRGRRLARIWTVASMYLCWVVVSGVTSWIIVGG